MPRSVAPTRYSEVTCVNCGDPLNEKVKELPHWVADDGGEGGGKQEAWCASCFHHHRAPLEPERFQPHRPEIGQGGYRAVTCGNLECLMTHVDIGRGYCIHCGCHTLFPVPPKAKAGVMGWSREVKRTVGLVAKRS